MAWNTYWNTGGLVLFVYVILFGILPLNVQARPQSAPVPTKVEDGGFNDSVIENNQNNQENVLQIGFVKIPVKEKKPILNNKSEQEAPTVSDLLEPNETPLPSVSELPEPNEAPVSPTRNEAPVSHTRNEAPVSPTRNEAPVSPTRNEAPRPDDRIIVSDFPGSRKNDFLETRKDDFPRSRKSCSKTGDRSSKTITYDDLRAGLETGGVLLIDVRNRTELETTCKLPWSFNVPLHEVTEAFALDENSFREKYGFPKPAPEDTDMVLTCRSGRRIQVARKILEPLGYCDVKLYSGSWLDWKARGGPLFPVFRDGKLLPEKCP